MEWVSKVEAGLLGLLIVAQIDFVIGSFLPPTDKQMANGYIGTVLCKMYLEVAVL